MHPDVEFQSSGVYPDFRTDYRGFEGVVQYWNAVRGLWQDFSLELARVEDLGDRVLVLIRQRVRGRDGIVAQHVWGHVFTFSEGRVRTVRGYASWEEALDAVGLTSAAPRD